MRIKRIMPTAKEAQDASNDVIFFQPSRACIKRPVVTVEQARLIPILYQREKMSFEDIGLVFGVSSRTIRMRLKLARVPTNTREDYVKKGSYKVKHGAYGCTASRAVS